MAPNIKSTFTKGHRYDWHLVLKCFTSLTYKGEISQPLPIPAYIKKSSHNPIYPNQSKEQQCSTCGPFQIHL